MPKNSLDADIMIGTLLSKLMNLIRFTEGRFSTMKIIKNLINPVIFLE